MKKILRLKAVLQDISPPIWREIAVHPSLSLKTLHRVLQNAFGWNESHLYEFRAGKLHFGVPDRGSPEVQDAKEASLSSLGLKAGDKILYVYDFGDDWRVDLTLADHAGELKSGAELLGGERSGPPDDCGGPPGYDELLKALAGPRHPEHTELKAWVRAWSPEDMKLEVLGYHVAKASGKAPAF